MIQKILVATDGSRHAEKAIALASNLAAKYQAKLLALHVLRPGDPTREELRLAEGEGLTKEAVATRVGRVEATPHGPHPLPAGVHEEVDREAVRRAIGERIVGTAQTMAEKDGVKAEALIESNGSEADCILAVVRRENPDLLIMGSRGVGSLESLLLGSVSQKVAKHANCTCITVK